MGLFVAVIVIIDVVLVGVVSALPYTWSPALLVPNEEHLSEETGVRWVLNQLANYCLLYRFSDAGLITIFIPVISNQTTH